MKLWFCNPPAETAELKTDHEPVEIGRYVLNTEEASATDLVRINRLNGTLPKNAAAWLVPAGLGGTPELIKALAQSDRPVMAAVNGLGPAALQALKAAMHERDLILLFDARDQDALAYAEQLAWLRAQSEPFAVMARSTEKLVQAAVHGPHSLVVPETGAVELGPILRIARAQMPKAPRPTSPAEVDHLLGREASLTVVKPIAAGDKITADDLTVIVSESRGLSPALRERIVGKVLRYTIKPGESLSFGHLDDEPAS